METLMLVDCFEKIKRKYWTFVSFRNNADATSKKLSKHFAVVESDSVTNYLFLLDSMIWGRKVRFKQVLLVLFRNSDPAVDHSNPKLKMRFNLLWFLQRKNNPYFLVWFAKFDSVRYQVD